MGGVGGRYIRLDSTNCPTNPAEIRVFGPSGQLTASTATSDSCFGGCPGSYPPSNCIDGDTTTICHTLQPCSGASWIQVDLGGYHSITSIEIVNDGRGAAAGYNRITGDIVSVVGNNGQQQWASSAIGTASNGQAFTFVPNSTTATASTCSDVLAANSGAASGEYDLTVNGRTLRVYCDMTRFGGGWALVTAISSSDRVHSSTRDAAGCNADTLMACVSFTGTSTAPTAPSSGSKLSDADAIALGGNNGTVRVDMANSYTTFFMLPGNWSGLDFTCYALACPRIITSHSYPYSWEAPSCSGLSTGYRIHYGVFDNHDHADCGSHWFSSQYNSQRLLYNYNNANGIYPGHWGNTWVKAS